MIRAYKTELNPNNKQQTWLIQCAGTSRFVFNWALTDRITRHAQGLQTSKFEQCKRFNILKKTQFPWIADVPYTVMQEEFDKCDNAYRNFFRRVKNGRQPGFPKFKSKKRGINSFTLRGSIVVEPNRIKLPRIGGLRLKESDYLPASGVKIISATISNQAGHWFVSLLVEVDAPKPLQLTDMVIGVDVGVKTLATCSNGVVFENPKSLSRYESKLARTQRELSRRVKGSKNRNKTKLKIAKINYRITNIRRYSLHEVSHYLTVIAKPRVIVLEDLNVKGMVRNHHLAKAISDSSFRELRRQIEYKASWYGEKVIIADRFYPSSKTCSQCGTVKPLLKLSERAFVCEECGAVMDRDFNASVNLASIGTAKQAGIACGVNVRPSKVGAIHGEAGSELHDGT